MKIELHKISVRDVVKNYEDNGWYYLDNSEINSAIKASDVGSPFLLFYQKMK